jgi:hypothetical protein
MSLIRGLKSKVVNTGSATESTVNPVTISKSVSIPEGYRTEFVKITLSFNFSSSATTITAAPLSSLLRSISIGPSYIDASAIDNLINFGNAYLKDALAEPSSALGYDPSVSAVSTSYYMTVYVPISFEGTRSVSVQTNAASSFNSATSATYTLLLEAVITQEPGKLFEIDFRTQTNLSLFTAVTPGIVYYIGGSSDLTSVINTISPPTANLTSSQIGQLQVDFASALGGSVEIQGATAYGFAFVLLKPEQIQINTSGAATLTVGELYEA